MVTTTIHKTIGGGRGGMIICKEELAKKINSAVFPGQQGGPLEHIIAGKAVALRIAASDAFRERQERTLAGARVVGEELLGAGGGVSVLTGGTDVHLVLCDLRESELDGKQAEDRLHSIGITVNRNAVPFDPRPPAVSSGLRIGSPALATRGLQVEDFVEIGKIIAGTLNPDGPFEDRQARAGRAGGRDRRALPAVRAVRRRRAGLSSPRRRLDVAAICHRLACDGVCASPWKCVWRSGRDLARKSWVGRHPGEWRRLRPAQHPESEVRRSEFGRLVMPHVMNPPNPRRVRRFGKLSRCDGRGETEIAAASASRQCGLVLREQLLAAGVAPGAIAHRVGNGSWP